MPLICEASMAEFIGARGKCVPFDVCGNCILMRSVPFLSVDAWDCACRKDIVICLKIDV